MQGEIYVSNIEWDTESDGEILSAEELGLPEELFINDKEICEKFDEDDYDELIGNYLAEQFGFCNKGFLAERA